MFDKGAARRRAVTSAGLRAVDTWVDDLRAAVVVRMASAMRASLTRSRQIPSPVALANDHLRRTSGYLATRGARTS